jgi:tRNA-dihydrouridine synthase B
MAGVSDAPFRRIIKKLASEAIVYSEFVSTNALSMGSKKTLRMLAYEPEVERPLIVQVFGADPKKFIEACKIIEDLGADAIDINMGCPAAKIVSSLYGSALMKKPELAAELVASVVKAISIPVSVKTRLGWDSSDALIPFCKKLVAAGASALAVHGRTYTQKFSGTADWVPIYELKNEVSVPVIGNGDIMSAADAVSKIGNLDGVMIGRGAVGNPWLISEICYALRVTRSSLPGITRNPSAPLRASPERATRNESSALGGLISFKEKIPFILEHCRLAVAEKGEERGMREMRRHLANYVRGIPGAAGLRAKLVRVERICEVEEILSGVTV